MGEDKERTLDRREVLGKGARLLGGVAAAAAAPGLFLAELSSAEGAKRFRSEPGKLLRVMDPKAVADLPGRYLPDWKTAWTMLEQGLFRLTGKRDLAEAWREFVHPSDVVMLKINCLGMGGRSIYSSPQVVYAVARTLVKAGVAENNVIIQEYKGHHLRAAGYRPNRGSTGIRVMDRDDWDFRRTATAVGSERTRFMKALDSVTAVVNIPVIKDHGLAGVTCAMKNLSHGLVDSPSSFHDRNCNPYIADIVNAPILRDKLRLHVADATWVLYDRGPRGAGRKYLKKHDSLYLTTDPVALDAVAESVIGRARAEAGLPTLTRRGSPPKYIRTAARLGLGIADLDRISLAEERLG
jgi:uncharacterized protein (DUF362 family)